MAQFHDPLDLRAEGSEKWILLAQYAYSTNVPRNPYLISVPKGFETDLASIPRLFRSLVPVIGRHRGAAVIHDYLYKCKGVLPGITVTRKQADQIFLEAMKVARVKAVRRYLMYQAVRAGGWLPWSN